MYNINVEMLNDEFASVTVKEGHAMRTSLLYNINTKEFGYAWSDDGIFYIKYNKENVKFSVPTIKLYDGKSYDCLRLLALDENCKVTDVCIIPSYNFYCDIFTQWLIQNEKKFHKQIEKSLVDSII